MCSEGQTEQEISRRKKERDPITKLAWERLGTPQEEVANVAREREVWSSLLELLPLPPYYPVDRIVIATTCIC